MILIANLPGVPSLRAQQYTSANRPRPKISPSTMYRELSRYFCCASSSSKSVTSESSTSLEKSRDTCEISCVWDASAANSCAARSILAAASAKGAGLRPCRTASPTPIDAAGTRSTSKGVAPEPTAGGTVPLASRELPGGSATRDRRAGCSPGLLGKTSLSLDTVGVVADNRSTTATFRFAGESTSKVAVEAPCPASSVRGASWALNCGSASSAGLPGRPRVLASERSAASVLLPLCRRRSASSHLISRSLARLRRSSSDHEARRRSMAGSSSAGRLPVGDMAPTELDKSPIVSMVGSLLSSGGATTWALMVACSGQSFEDKFCPLCCWS
mmetsp:Transcript_20842/g.46528  ORF Transcript_20842/g.46528 Transcript_20842/m.46528 type:complete len:330 (-) Transcript_20842:5-994(-)